MSGSRKRPNNEAVVVKWKKRKENNDAVTPTQRRHYGLYNQGATCYLNSVLQVFSMTTELHDRLEPKSQTTDQELIVVFKKLKKTCKTKNTGKSLAIENANNNSTSESCDIRDPRAKQTDLQLRKIFEGLKEATCRTETITAAFGILNVGEQRDAAECLEMILRKISPQASEVFQGALRHTTKCSKGHIIIEETNEFWTLPLSLNDTHDSSYSVESGFERIFQSKPHNGVYCNECEETTEATSRCEMVVFPQILTLLLKKFDFDNTTRTHSKTNRRVHVPRELETKDMNYELYAVVNHIGSVRGGHYTATILSNEDRTWYEFDDTHVSKVKEQLFAETRTYNSSTAYLLMYRAAAKHDDTNQIPPPTLNTSHSSRPPDSTSVEIEKDESSQKLSKSPTCKMTPLWISLILIACVLVAILIVVLSIIYS
ncbi:putative ubiquitin carboxyl-terminal hydrolase 50 [Anarrhichthys ocellatus]|uniref:putative ubiquitin carboxyl-terminal hydrolase 50 n=1 Tax=Anarrhichthys ocellatus TaxID=433405 RepID=UPI0012EECC23|nr:putative ubiquitin carboxyl-terminal hydrolase 50 [Anarrhichthys ocellatus]XP_031707200.1 putative ubiquitin carboxyl-terminal hydrolase 50 [Anarrhichthys ocellatus]XP_031707201.1 putative ubiquitin carboxyl-terminal hydrolase 50 [Anarrhichthys ocellatus]XP_031707203.1 putative ubiquitin carboxyl-terminal hydrolase 50 [Anarrhichthys ocellatus]